jgi:DNA-binding transcriptional LysR family regulator
MNSELRLFLAIYDARNLTRAAEVVGLSQPAMSRALGRLQILFGDALFVRIPKGMEPTPRATALAEDVRDLTTRYDALVRPTQFSPRDLKRTFTLGATDFAEVVLLPALAKRLASEAPGVSIALRAATPESEAQLEQGELDAIIAPSTSRESFVSLPLLEDGFTCVLRKGHPALRGTLTLEKYLSLSHILIAPRGTPGSAVDDVLKKQGYGRHVAVRTTSFIGAPMLAAESDMILTAPTRVIGAVVRYLPLVRRDVPIAIPSFSVRIFYHPRTKTDSAQSWFRSILRTCVPKVKQ